MAAQTTPRKEEPEQPINDSRHSPITIHSTWAEIHQELMHVKAELQQLKEEIP